MENLHSWYYNHGQISNPKPRAILMANITTLTVNGKKLPLNVGPEVSLLSVLRNDLDLTGTKYGCGESQCGACTVLVDGQPTRSCVTQVGKVAGKQITTIEGLEKDGRLHPLQEAFLKADAMQCGYCTSGMIMSGVGLLNKNARPTRDEIVRHMDGNVCRCGTYQRIVAAIEMASGNPKEIAK
jgi:aerobic-type carbon monoxide dehydrogenase small subunit (CoxS/CutS family)